MIAAASRLMRKQPLAYTVDDNLNPYLELGKGDECLATFWHQATPGTTYWRCLIPARHLPGQTLPVTHKDLAEDKNGIITFPRMKGDTAVWQFLGDSNRSRMALGLRNLTGVRTLMEVDDNYTKAPQKRYRTTWTDKIEDAHTKTGYSYEAHRILAREVDGIICTTDYLANLYSDYNDVWVCPNSIDPDDWQYDRAEPDGVFRIVYYGGQSHVFDTPLVTKALKWASRQPDVEIWTMGLDAKDWSFPHRKIGWTYDLAQARSPLFKFDLGVAPVNENDWMKGKSDLKFLEYGMAGVLPLVSRAEPYRPWFDVAPDLVVEKDDWMDAIRWAVKNPDLVRDRAQDIRNYVLEHRTIQDSIHLWREAIS